MGLMQFYFRARNTFERIEPGDLVLIDTKCEVAPFSIVLTYPEMIITRFDKMPIETCVGKVVCSIVTR